MLRDCGTQREQGRTSHCIGVGQPTEQKAQEENPNLRYLLLWSDRGWTGVCKFLQVPVKGLRDVLGASVLEMPVRGEEAATFRLHVDTET